MARSTTGLLAEMLVVEGKLDDSALDPPLPAYQAVAA